MTAENCKKELKQIGGCVIIPTYNNERTLSRVIDSALEYANDIYVVCDGPTDSTLEILEGYQSQVRIISYSPNKGKGRALRTGFKEATKDGFRYAITIDSDGQHFPEDIPNFIEKVKEIPDSLIVGRRNMNQEGVPGKSSFGHKFSNFWFRFETGINLPDTQSGFRLYPLHELNKLRFYTTKFEFEIEVMVKAAWANVPVVSVPIQVLYNPEERVTHFRPFKDFTRISILNTYLVTLAIAYYRPRNFILQAKKKSLKQLVIDEILDNSDSIKSKTLSVMLGLFIGCAPMWGAQTAAVIGLAFVFKLNRPIAFLASNISIPPLIPFIIWGSVKIGEVLTGEKISFNFDSDNFGTLFQEHVMVYVVGAIVFASLVSLLGGVVTYITLLGYKKVKN